MRKTLFILILSVSTFFLNAANVSADAPISEASASIRREDSGEDYRVGILKAYLEKHGSPLADYADTFVEAADKYGIDWRLVPAITGVESTFGKRIPANSFNAYGWANGDYRFNSWEESIEIVTKTLREKYIDKGAASIAKIARRYAPPSATWGAKVKFFMKKIEPLPVTFSLEG
jgi:hypothetical protein